MERPVVEFDHHDPEFHADRIGRWAEVQKCPVAWNPAYGGFWAVSGYDAVATVSREGDVYTSLYDPDGASGVACMGIAGVPRSKAIPPAGIAEVEGKPHQALRRAMNPFLLPPAVKALEPFIEDVSRWFIDQHIESGAMDLVEDFASPVPAVLTMKLIGLPCDTWQHYAELFHATIAHRPTDDVYRRAVSRVPEMMGGVLAEAAKRRDEPRDDMLTSLVQMDLSEPELTAVLWNLIGGGLDTTTSLTSLSLRHLAAHPDQRARLAAEPGLLDTATEEFLRFFSVNETLTRTVSTDTELGGQALRRGEIVLISWLAANRDPAHFADPDDVVLDRAPNPHLAFGVGPHRCIGMHLARTMFKIMVRQVLERLPDYVVDESQAQGYSGNPTLNGMVRMPATFTPGPRTGPDERPF